MNTLILTFDILRSTSELVQLSELLGEENIYPIGVNCHAYLIRFTGSATDFREYLIQSETIYPYEDFFVAEVEKWSAALRGRQKLEVPTFLESNEESYSHRRALA